MVWQLYWIGVRQGGGERVYFIRWSSGSNMHDCYASSASTHGDFGTADNQNHLSQVQTGENVQLNFVQHDLAVKRRTLAELERANLRRAVVEERRRFAELITCLKPVLVSLQRFGLLSHSFGHLKAHSLG
ncbi:Metastasis suppressor protein 1 [Fasciola gigantica]|uniref:Metastasis suppressor protein 1 n=1 Tax=Fasciola gigantica TaxID=46835 RepID=A0A504YEE3_FASGI|nr:Metastasis suppressor protein 1 [Fasciola gigantica]